MSNIRSFETLARQFKKSGTINRLLITGASGRVGSELFNHLKLIYGAENFLLTDLKNTRNLPEKQFKTLDVRDRKAFDKVIHDFRPDTIIHLANVETLKGEKDPELALSVNANGTHNAIEIATENKLKLFYGSFISAFGADTPRRNAPSMTIQRPHFISGVSTVYMELLGEYYYHKYGTDFRSLRFPVVITPTQALEGVTAGLVDIYYNAVTKGKYTQYLKPNLILPAVYISDLAYGTAQLLEAKNEQLNLRIYNVGSCSFSPSQQVASIQKYIPNFQVDYSIDETRQSIAETWPQSIDDFDARNDWGYEPQYDLDSITREMIDRIKKNA